MDEIKTNIWWAKKCLKKESKLGECVGANERTTLTIFLYPDDWDVTTIQSVMTTKKKEVERLKVTDQLSVVYRKEGIEEDRSERNSNQMKNLIHRMQNVSFKVEGLN